MSLDTAIERFRQRQEALFRDEGVVSRSGAPGAFDEDTGMYAVGAGAEEIYSGPCQVRPAGGLAGTEVNAGEREIRLNDFILKLPADTSVVKDDIFTVSASRYDADLVGRSFRITDIMRDGRQIARVCVMEEAT